MGFDYAALFSQALPFLSFFLIDSILNYVCRPPYYQTTFVGSFLSNAVSEKGLIVLPRPDYLEMQLLALKA